MDPPRRPRRRPRTSRRPLALAPQRRRPKHVPANTTAEFRYTLHLDAAPTRASLHIVSPGSLRRQPSTAPSPASTKPGEPSTGKRSAPSSNPATTKSSSKSSRRQKSPPPSSPPPSPPPSASPHQTAPNAASPATPHGKPAPTATPHGNPHTRSAPSPRRLSIGTDRHSEVPGPNRIATDAALLRKDFTLPSTIQSARLTITALGAYQAFLNGKPIAPQTLLNPGWTDFHKRVLYQTYDVTPLLTTGDNTIAAILGGGWHGSPMTWAGTRAYPEPDALRAQLDITLTDGTHKTIATDETWQTAPAPTLFSEIYAGEVYDARLETPGWNAPHFTATRLDPRSHQPPSRNK